MALIEWSSDYSVNVSEIDSQHKKWVEIINNLHDHMKQAKGEAALGGIIEDLEAYTIFHFKTEEDYFDKFKYVHSAVHKREHELMRQKIKGFKDKFA